jgi:hypothetical protein
MMVVIATRNRAKLSAGELEEGKRLLEESQRLTTELVSASAPDAQPVFSPEEEKERTRAAMGLYQSLAAMASLQVCRHVHTQIERENVTCTQRVIYNHTPTHSHMHTQTHIHTHTYIYIYIYIYIYMRTRTNTRTHTAIHIGT